MFGFIDFFISENNSIKYYDYILTEKFPETWCPIPIFKFKLYFHTHRVQNNKYKAS